MMVFNESLNAACAGLLVKHCLSRFASCLKMKMLGFFLFSELS